MPVVGCALAGAAHPTAKAKRAKVFLKEILPFARAATARSLPSFQAAEPFDSALSFPGIGVLPDSPGFQCNARCNARLASP